ncbi:MAG TPA: DNA primase, partial [Chlamydiales bacterium]|nr:DNA primase [Chlamydiales bacterium]
MPLFSKTSLETLRERIDLIEVLSSHLDLKRSGGSYKACCPFHDEKSPSFIVKRGDSHYHCFGCGAHGDAIAFLMNHLKMSFSDSVEQLAERFGVRIEKIDEKDAPQGPNKKLLRAANEEATHFFSSFLLHTEEGHRALNYLYERGLDLDFVRSFRIGYAPRDTKVFFEAMLKKGHSMDVLAEVALMAQNRMPFFRERIMFPILDAGGQVVGFSGRKIQDSSFGPKYINTSDTPLFKKSKVLFGLHESRKRIAKEKKVIICEGQIDALRLIQEGFNFTVAGQGTAFGQEQANELMHLGVTHIYLALDGDRAGQEAAVKIGHFFQKEGVDVSVALLPEGSDPDTLLRTEGPPSFAKLLEEADDYLTFLVRFYSQGQDLSRPAVKTELVQIISRRIREWNHPLMIHESLRKLAKLTHVPESTIGVDQVTPVDVIIKKTGTLSGESIDPERVLEMDLLRWMLLV